MSYALEQARARAEARRAVSQAARPTVMPGTAQGSVDLITGTVVVLLDEGVAIEAQLLAGISTRLGDRVAVMFSPPAAAFVIGAWRGLLDDWHYVGDTSDPIAPAFGTGWGAWLLTDFAQPRFTRTPDGWVEYEGLMFRTSGAGTSLWTFPAGYMPSLTGHQVHSWAVNGGVARGDVHSTGLLQYGGGLSGTPNVEQGTAGWLFVKGRFRAEA